MLTAWTLVFFVTGSTAFNMNIVVPNIATREECVRTGEELRNSISRYVTPTYRCIQTVILRQGDER